MELYSKKRIEIVIEAPARARVERVLEKAGATGYTVMPAIAGKGHDGAWRREGLVGSAGQMIVILCITDEARARAILEAMREIIDEQIAIVSIGTVEVLRGDHF